MKKLTAFIVTTLLACSGCINGVDEYEISIVKGKITWAETGQGVAGLNVFLTRWYQPVFRMGLMEPVDETWTDDQGNFEFDVKGRGVWSIDWDERKSGIYRTAYSEKIHGTELNIQVEVERRRD